MRVCRLFGLLALAVEAFAATNRFPNCDSAKKPLCAAFAQNPAASAFCSVILRKTNQHDRWCCVADLGAEDRSPVTSTVTLPASTTTTTVSKTSCTTTTTAVTSTCTRTVVSVAQYSTTATTTTVPQSTATATGTSLSVVSTTSTLVSTVSTTSISVITVPTATTVM